jgi:DNA replication protein DnaC
MRSLQKHLASVKLLILDELGYVPFTAVGGELLFEVLSQRYERGSTLITSNLPFDEWTSVFVRALDWRPARPPDPPRTSSR